MVQRYTRLFPGHISVKGQVCTCVIKESARGKSHKVSSRQCPFMGQMPGTGLGGQINLVYPCHARPAAFTLMAFALIACPVAGIF